MLKKIYQGIVKITNPQQYSRVKLIQENDKISFNDAHKILRCTDEMLLGSEIMGKLLNQAKNVPNKYDLQKKSLVAAQIQMNAISENQRKINGILDKYQI